MKTISLTEAQLNVVLLALSKLPLEISYETFVAVRGQVAGKPIEDPKPE